MICAFLACRGVPARAFSTRRLNLTHHSYQHNYSFIFVRKLKHTFFNDSEVGNIDVRINYNKVGNSFEGVAIVEIKLDNGGKQYITYSESTGKHVFKSQTDYYAFLSTLKYS